MENATNTIILRGTIQELPVFSHENHGKRFSRFYLKVPRLSGVIDTLPVIAEEQLLMQLNPVSGQMLTVTGQMRSHNHREDGVRHLMIFVFLTIKIVNGTGNIYIQPRTQSQVLLFLF